MKTKILILILPVFLAMTGCTLAQQLVLPTKPWNATVKVVGEDGSPIGGANVSIAYTKPPYAFSDEPAYHGIISGTTDGNGVFSATDNDRTGIVGFSVDKQGYYQTRWAKELRDPSENADDRDISVTLVLKKIGKPIPMYAKKAEIKMPKEGEPIGFDLTAGDWVAPYGKGKTADFLFTVHRKIVSPRKFDADLELTFSNAGDGMVIVPPLSTDNGGSPLMLPRTAAETGYESAFKWSYHDFTETSRPAGGYLFRVRTVLDANGNVQSALYGKIEGDVRFLVGSRMPCAGIAFQYYLNPTPNDRNLEFDPKQNLLHGLKSFEQVREP